MLRAAALIARNDLRRRMRSRAFLLQALVGPLVLAGVVSLAFGSSFGFDAEIGVVAADHSEIGDRITRELVAASGDGLTFSAVADAATAHRRVRSGSLNGAVVIPAGFQASLSGPTPKAVQVITDPQEQIGEAVTRAVAGTLAARVNAGRLATLALLSEGHPAPDPASLLAADLPVSLRQRGTGSQVSPAAAIGPGMGLLFLFLSVSTVARSLLEERRLRVLDRILSAPVSFASILLGKCAGIVLVGCVSMTVLWGATSVLLGAHWGAPAGVALLIVASSLAVAGLGGVIASLADSEQLADTYGTMFAFVFGILGGSLVPLSQLPPGLLRLSLGTPNGWALRGFAELSAGEGGLRDVLPYAGVLLVWAVVAGGLAAVLLPRRLVPR